MQPKRATAAPPQQHLSYTTNEWHSTEHTAPPPRFPYDIAPNDDPPNTSQRLYFLYFTFPNRPKTETYA